jgi:hypothetical protein
MSEENKAVVDRLTQAFNEGNLDVLDEIVAPNFVGHNPLSPEDIQGPDGLKGFFAASTSGESLRVRLWNGGSTWTPWGSCSNSASFLRWDRERGAILDLSTQHVSSSGVSYCRAAERSGDMMHIFMIVPYGTTIVRLSD